MVIANDQVQSIIATLNRAIDTTEVISTFVQWMGTTYGPTLCALLNQESSSISLSNSSGYAVPDMLIQWMRSPDSWLAWQGWETMRKVDLTNPITGLQIEQAGFMIPLHYDHSTRGMVWVERSGPAAEVQATNEQIVTLVVGMLSARLHYLDANASWSTLVDKLNDFNQGLTQQNSVEGIWEMVHDRLPLLFDTSSFYVSLWQPDDGQLNTPVAWQDGLQVEQEPIPLMGLSKAVITQGSPLLFRDLTQETDRLADMSVELDNREPGAGARAWLGAPLRNRQNEVIGLMSMQSDLPNHFGDPDLALMTLVALQIAQAVENQRLLQTEQERRRVASTLMEVSQVIGSTLDTDIVLDRILEQLQRVIGYDRASIIVPTVDVNDGTQMVVSASQGMQVYAIGQDIRLADDNPGRYVFLSQQPVVISDLQALPSSPNRTQRQDELPVRSWMGLPMVSQGRVSGLIILEKVEPGFYSEEQASTAFALARQMAVALENARLHEKSVEASRLKSEFLANMSHELRTPLNAIIGYSEMLMSQIYGELNSKQYDRVARVVSGGKHLLEMINDVLDLSRIEAGQMNLSLVEVTVSDIVYDAIADVTPQVEAKGLKLNVNLENGLPLVQADAQRVRQIVVNLLDNAVKFTAEGSVTVDVASVVIESGVPTNGRIFPPEVDVTDGNWVVLSVKDTGIGIAREDQGYIFEAFRQVDSSSVRKFEGSGLGLAITQQLVRIHQGTIWVESDLGQGSKFTVLLPAGEIKSEEQGRDTDHTGDEPLVLLVDNDATALEVMESTLGAAHYKIMATTSTQQALEVARRLHPSAIIADVLMPDKLGWELLRVLKAESDTAAIPVVLISQAGQDFEDPQQWVAATLTKPINRDILLRTLRAVVL